MEYVVLVDEQNNEIGIAPKESVHTKNTPLHRGFSVFVFNKKNELLLTRRALGKKTFPGIWTNTVCGHPGKDESVIDAAKRRLAYELGLVVDAIKEITPYRYQCSDMHGIEENEICPILIGYTNSDPQPHDDEVDDWKWIQWDEFMDDIKKHPDVYSPWSREEAMVIEKILDVKPNLK